jgi:hypothetical protein
MELMNQHRGGTTPGGHLLTRLGVYTANPAAFLVLIVYAALWYMFKPETFEWHGTTGPTPVWIARCGPWP